MPLPVAAGAIAGAGARGVAMAGGGEALAVAGVRGVAVQGGKTVAGAELGTVVRQGSSWMARASGGGWAARAAGGLRRAMRGGTEVMEQLSAQRVTSPSSAADRNESALGEVKEFANALGKWLPKFGHSITVNVRGGPRADLRRCWYLAVAACFGRYMRGLSGVWGRSINAQWNVTGKEVSITLAYTFSGIVENTYGSIMDESGLSILQRGPDQVTVGAGWPKWMLTTRQLLGSGLNGWQPFVGGPATAILSGGGLRNVAPGAGVSLDSNQTGQGQNLSRAGGGMLVTTRVDSVDARQLIEGWRLGNEKNAQPLPARVFQPYRFKPVPNIFRELPIRPPGGSVRPSPEALPFRRIRPGFTETTFYVLRGGQYGTVPVLPDDGRVITTGEKGDPRVQPPKPPVDGVSRAHPLAMITAILGNPGVLVDAPINAGNTLGSEGVYAYTPGSAVNAYDLWGLPALVGQPHPAALNDSLNSIITTGGQRVEVPRDVINITGGG